MKNLFSLLVAIVAFNASVVFAYEASGDETTTRDEVVVVETTEAAAETAEASAE